MISKLGGTTRKGLDVMTEKGHRVHSSWQGFHCLAKRVETGEDSNICMGMDADRHMDLLNFDWKPVA